MGRKGEGRGGWIRAVAAEKSAEICSLVGGRLRLKNVCSRIAVSCACLMSQSRAMKYICFSSGYLMYLAKKRMMSKAQKPVG